MSADIGKSVRDRLSKRTAVTNLVGDRIFDDFRDQGTTLPAIVVTVDDDDPEHDLSGTNQIFPSTITVLSFATDRPAANNIALQIKNDALPPDLYGIVEGMIWQEVTLEGQKRYSVEPQNASDSAIRVTEQQFKIWNAAT